jgi:hypothetical protein
MNVVAICAMNATQLTRFWLKFLTKVLLLSSNFLFFNTAVWHSFTDFIVTTKFCRKTRKVSTGLWLHCAYCMISELRSELLHKTTHRRKFVCIVGTWLFIFSLKIFESPEFVSDSLLVQELLKRCVNTNFWMLVSSLWFLRFVRINWKINLFHYVGQKHMKYNSVLCCYWELKNGECLKT